MSALDPLQRLTRNPITHHRHRREVLWQITVPLVIAVLVFLALAILAGLAASGQASLWADISLIWLILPMLLCSFIAMVFLAGFAFGIVKLVDVLPTYARQVQEVFRLINLRISHLCDRAVEPVLRSQSFSASARKLGRSLRRRI